MSDLQAQEYKNFEAIKKVRDDGTEYWTARELCAVLQYKKWENFDKVIDRAKLACKNSGYEILNHFPEVRKMVEIGSNTTRELLDYELSRYACYLIVQNGDPRKEVIALGQTYFAIQTRRQEVGTKVRKAIEDIGGTMPENLPRPQKSIKQVEKEQLKKLKDKNKKLMLDE